MLDCVIIGGGAAGLVAATYLARYRRDLLLIDAGDSRLHRIPRARNAPGFPEGVEGRDLWNRLRRQAETNGAKLVTGRVINIFRDHTGFTVLTAESAHETKAVLIATGVLLVEPNIEKIDDAIRRGIVRYCPICDGFEAQGKSIAVLGGDPNALHEARFLSTYSDRVTYIPATEAACLSASDQLIAKAYSVGWSEKPATSIRVCEDGVSIEFDESSKTYDILYPALGCKPQNHLAKAVGALVSDTGGVLTDHHQRTNVAGLYAAGDVVEGLDQIAAAFGHAAIAATAIHNDLNDLGSSAQLLKRDAKP